MGDVGAGALAGIDSVNAPHEVRAEAYARLARDLDLAKLESTVTEFGLAEGRAVRHHDAPVRPRGHL